MDILTERAS